MRKGRAAATARRAALTGPEKRARSPACLSRISKKPERSSALAALPSSRLLLRGLCGTRSLRGTRGLRGTRRFLRWSRRRLHRGLCARRWRRRPASVDEREADLVAQGVVAPDLRDVDLVVLAQPSGDVDH